MKTNKAMNDAFKESYTKFHKEYPEYTTSRRFDRFKSYYTSTIQIFRGGNVCPDIELEHDELGAAGIFNRAGLWDFDPFKRDDVMTDAFIKALPFPKGISLKNLLQDPAFRDKHIRLYLFCCRVEVKGAEVSNSQESNVSQGSRLGLTKEGDAFSFPKNSTRRSKNRSAGSQSQ